MRHIPPARLSAALCFYEEIFMNILTQEKKYGIIAMAETMYDCCGDADAAAEAPPRLTSRQT